jgi:hypothetical protein
MGLSNNHHEGELGAAAISGSLSAVVTQLRAELNHLVTHDDELRQRIRYVHGVLRGLQHLSKITSAANLCPPAQHPPADGTIAGRSSHERPEATRRRSSQPSITLQRACRIALMELANPISLEEIYARIVRRGSFSFANPLYATRSLIPVLRAMIRNGEVRCLKIGPCWLWERIGPIHERATIRIPHRLASLRVRDRLAANGTSTAVTGDR